MQTTEDEVRAHAEWLEKRRSGLGGTDTPAICGLSRYKGPYEVWCEKLGLVSKPIDNPQTKLGRALEPYIAREWGEKFKLELVKGEFVKHDLIEWLLGTPDYLVRNQRRGLDCKYISSEEVEKFYGVDGTDDLPMHYWGQGQHYMELFDYDYWHFGCLMTDGEVHDYPVERDPVYLRTMRETCDIFWNKHVKEGIPPEPTLTSACQEYIDARFPRHKDKLVVRAKPGDALEELVYLLRDAKVAAKQTACAAEELELRIKAVMGEAASVLWCGDEKITWKNNRDSEKTDWEAALKEILTSLPLGKEQTRYAFDIIQKHREIKPGPRVFRTPRRWLKDIGKVEEADSEQAETQEGAA